MPVQIHPDMYWIGVNDRTTDLFEGLWPITQEGVSYNSYLIRDEKNVIIDLAKAFKSDVFFSQINEVFDLSEIDYVVINHVEPDHTGVLKILPRLSPKAVFLATPKAKKMLQDFYGLGERVREVADGETLSIGKHTLQFFHIPFVHWPETMATYERKTQVLFSCDAFGGYGALKGVVFDDECTDKDFYERESLRYYVNIVAKFHVSVLKAIDKLGGIDISAIAPSHGLIWRKEPEKIVALYKKWSEYAKQPGEPGVTLVYGSMYGNTETVMNAVGQGISSENIPVDIFDAARTHVSYILPSLWVNSGVMVGAPTYEAALFPPIADVITMAGRKSIKGKTAAMFGSFGWSGGALRELKSLIEPLKWDLKDSLEFPGGSTHELLMKAETFGKRFAQTLKQQA